VKKFVYIGLIQDIVAPAGYFRDVNNLKTYEKKSVFLPSLNNEEDTSQNDGELTDMAQLRQSRFANLNQAMFVMFSKDTMIYPKETAWFQQLDSKGDLLPLNSTAFYQNDNIGLKSLTEAGKAQYTQIDGDHLQFTEADIDNIIIPFLE
jgi:palmitoyl-protein thioesterase